MWLSSLLALRSAWANNLYIWLQDTSLEALYMWFYAFEVKIFAAKIKKHRLSLLFNLRIGWTGIINCPKFSGVSQPNCKPFSVLSAEVFGESLKLKLWKLLSFSAEELLKENNFLF